MPRTTTEPPGFPAEIPGAPDLESLREVMVRCTRCDLAVSRTQVVPGAGPPDARVLLVGEAPGASEDRSGQPFVGSSGRLLGEVLTTAGLRREELFIANVVRCRPPENRSPRSSEIRACAGWLAEQLRLIRPAVVVTLGRFTLLHFVPGGKISQLQGEPLTVDYRSARITIYPLLHPAAILRARDRRAEYEDQFRRLSEIVARLA